MVFRCLSLFFVFHREVYKAKCKKSGEFVALKKVLTENEKEGVGTECLIVICYLFVMIKNLVRIKLFVVFFQFPITALREIKILQVLQHENIVRLIEICTSKATAANKFKSQFFLVFEFCEHDLAGLLSNPAVKFALGEQKKIMQQLLNGTFIISLLLLFFSNRKY